MEHDIEGGIRIAGVMPAGPGGVGLDDRPLRFPRQQSDVHDDGTRQLLGRQRPAKASTSAHRGSSSSGTTSELAVRQVPAPGADFTVEQEQPVLHGERHDVAHQHRRVVVDRVDRTAVLPPG